MLPRSLNSSACREPARVRLRQHWSPHCRLKALPCGRLMILSRGWQGSPVAANLPFSSATGYGPADSFGRRCVSGCRCVRRLGSRCLGSSWCRSSTAVSKRIGRSIGARCWSWIRRTCSLYGRLVPMPKATMSACCTNFPGLPGGGRQLYLLSSQPVLRFPLNGFACVHRR